MIVFVVTWQCLAVLVAINGLIAEEPGEARILSLRDSGDGSSHPLGEHSGALDSGSRFL